MVFQERHSDSGRHTEARRAPCQGGAVPWPEAVGARAAAPAGASNLNSGFSWSRHWNCLCDWGMSVQGGRHQLETAAPRQPGAGRGSRGPPWGRPPLCSIRVLKLMPGQPDSQRPAESSRGALRLPVLGAAQPACICKTSRSSSNFVHKTDHYMQT